MRDKCVISGVLATVLRLWVWPGVVHAVITTSGNIAPTPPLTDGINLGQDLIVADTANGQVTIDVLGFTSKVDNGSGFTETINLTGSGASWDNGSINVGVAGIGTVNVTAGADITGGGVIGVNPGSDGTVVINGSGGGLATAFVGLEGSVALTIENQATVSGVSPLIGFLSGPTAVSPWAGPARVDP